MINHIVMMKLNEQEGENLAGELQSYANRIREKIPVVRHYEIVPNIAGAEPGFNWAIISKFDNDADMAAYKNDPLHLEFVHYCDPRTENICFLDYE